jgi:hypothetical protein
VPGDLAGHLPANLYKLEDVAMAVKVLTVREAAARLGARPEAVALKLARAELTPATINDRPAVLDDITFRRLLRKSAKVAA